MTYKLTNTVYFHNIIVSIKMASLGAELYPTDIEGHLTSNKIT